jgi:hypothetical protein
VYGDRIAFLAFSQAMLLFDMHGQQPASGFNAI